MAEPVDRPSFEERREKTIWQRLDEVDQVYAAGHTRLRKSIEQLEAHVDTLAEKQEVLTERLRALSEAPVDAMKLMLTSRQIMAVVIAALAIAGSIWGTYASTNSNIARLETKADAQTEKMKSANELQAVQMATLRDAASDAKATAADAKRQYELLRYEFQSLKETVIAKGKQP